MKRFENKNSDGLKTVQIEDVYDVTDNYEISSADFTRTYTKFVNNKSDGWNRFMEKLHSNLTYHVTKIIPVTFIKNPPSDYDAIFTSFNKYLRYIEKYYAAGSYIVFDGYPGIKKSVSIETVAAATSA